MKKRQKKKLLLRAIKALNNDVSKDLGLPEITHYEAVNVYRKIKGSKNATRNTLRDYHNHILHTKRSAI